MKTVQQTKMERRKKKKFKKKERREEEKKRFIQFLRMMYTITTTSNIRGDK